MPMKLIKPYHSIITGTSDW